MTGNTKTQGYGAIRRCKKDGCKVPANHGAVSADGKGGHGKPAGVAELLSSACRNYKCRFDEQLHIHAQRPDAVAVAGLKLEQAVKRWVNKDSRRHRGL